MMTALVRRRTSFVRCSSKNVQKKRSDEEWSKATDWLVPDFKEPVANPLLWAMLVRRL